MKNRFARRRKICKYLLFKDRFVLFTDKTGLREVGKMSKRYFNVVNPDDVVDRYGADCFRMYEMFLGPIEQAKPWDTQGIDGVSKFLRRLSGGFLSLRSPPSRYRH